MIRHKPDSDEIAQFGFKASGLMCLPKLWVPEFEVLPSRRTRDFAARRPLLKEVKSSLDALRESLQHPSILTEVYVRSSSPTETLVERGRLHSYRVSATPEAVSDATARIAVHAESVGSDRLAIMIQRRIEPTALGHLSNERRVSRARNLWRLEEHWPNITSRTMRPSQGSANQDLPLKRQRISQPPEEVLSQVAHDLTLEDFRYHIEWVSDADAIWIVQCDHETRVEHQPPCHAWASQKKPSGEPRYRVLSKASGTPETGSTKAQHVCLFKELGLPYGEVLLLDDISILSGLAKGEIPGSLTEDVVNLAQSPVVVRSDIAGGDGLFAPRSDVLDDENQVLDFLVDKAATLAEDIKEGRVAFLLHRFVAARAGAFAYARPDVSRVRIDATWGIPDSLLFCPHDTYDIDLKDPDRVRSDVRWKGHFVDVDATGSFVEREAGWAWDWRTVLTSEQVLLIAESTHSIAKALGQRVQVMFFVGTADGLGYPDVLPWFIQRDDDFDPAQVSPAALQRRPIERTVRTLEDLKVIQRDVLELQVDAFQVAIVLRPTTQFLRDTEFLEAVGSFTSDKNIPVLLEGSVLSHAFYVLRRSGAHVFERSAQDRRRAPEVPLNKLVRDHIPTLVLDKSEDVLILRRSGDELIQLLNLKAIEEAFELSFAVGREALVEELGDLFEVVRSLSSLLGLDLVKLTEVADQKKEARGGFDEGIVLVSTQERVLGDAGIATEAEVTDTPGRVPPYVVQTDDNGPIIRIPVRSVGLPTPQTTYIRLAGLDFEVEVDYRSDAVDVLLMPANEPQPQGQLTFNL